MSLTDMAWLTQGPMAAADLELDVDSMEQEAEAYWLTSVPGYEPLDNPSLGTMGVVTVGIGQSVRSKSKNEDGNLIFRMECDEQLVDESTPTFKGNIAQEPRTFVSIILISNSLYIVHTLYSRCKSARNTALIRVPTLYKTTSVF